MLIPCKEADVIHFDDKRKIIRKIIPVGFKKDRSGYEHIKVLYVEDELFLGKIVKESLESRGFEVVWKAMAQKHCVIIKKPNPIYVSLISCCQTKMVLPLPMKYGI